jgi:hypothetical protein
MLWEPAAAAPALATPQEQRPQEQEQERPQLITEDDIQSKSSCDTLPSCRPREGADCLPEFLASNYDETEEQSVLPCIEDAFEPHIKIEPGFELDFSMASLSSPLATCSDTETHTPDTSPPPTIRTTGYKRRL